MVFISIAANSSTPLKITSTDEGIRLYTFVSYYNDLLQVTWHYKYDLCLHCYLCKHVYISYSVIAPLLLPDYILLYQCESETVCCSIFLNFVPFYECSTIVQYVSASSTCSLPHVPVFPCHVASLTGIQPSPSLTV